LHAIDGTDGNNFRTWTRQGDYLNDGEKEEKNQMHSGGKGKGPFFGFVDLGGVVRRSFGFVWNEGLNERRG
jgi:hypothetical protein